jgi:hypothetical protein
VGTLLRFGPARPRAKRQTSFASGARCSRAVGAEDDDSRDSSAGMYAWSVWMPETHDACQETHVGIVFSVQPRLCLTPQAQPTCTLMMFCHAMAKQDRCRGTDPVTARCNSLTQAPRSAQALFALPAQCLSLAESQASQRVRYVAKAPANPFPLVYERNTMSARLRRKALSFVKPLLAARLHPTGFLLARSP